MRTSVPRILDVDIENRPIAYGGGDWTTADITAIAAGFDPEGIHCFMLTDSRTDHEYRIMLHGFRELYDKADIVTGHYIRNHDLPIINGAMIEFGMPPLGPKMTCDTKNDLVRFKDLSKSQEGLGAMLGLSAPKVHMSPHDWRQANRLQRTEAARARVIGDVRQHMELRVALLKAGALGKMKTWRP